MTEITTTLEAIADGYMNATAGSESEARTQLIAALRDAYELGAMSKPEPAPAPRTAFGQAANPDQRAGFLAHVMHSIPAQVIEQHGENALLAMLRQTMRDLAQTGADPFRDMSIQVVGMPDGASVVTGEARV